MEFALIAPLLFMIVFGILYFGVAFMKMQNLRSAVREGGRAAAVEHPRSAMSSRRCRRPPSGRSRTPDVSVSRLCDGDEVLERTSP